MRHSTENTTKRKTSIFVRLFRKAKRKIQQLPTPQAFSNKNKGSITFRKTKDNAYMACFKSDITGKRAHAWGSNFNLAYSRMIRNFNEKYA